MIHMRNFNKLGIKQSYFGFFVLFLLKVSLRKIIQCIFNAFFWSFSKNFLVELLMFSSCFYFIEVLFLCFFCVLLHLLILFFDDDLDGLIVVLCRPCQWGTWKAGESRGVGEMKQMTVIW